MQRILNIEGNRKVADMLWEFLNHPFASVSIKFRHYMYLIYREIYYEMAPVCFQNNFERMEIDTNWFDSENQIIIVPEVNKEKKLIQLRYLILNKRKRTNGIFFRNINKCQVPKRRRSIPEN